MTQFKMGQIHYHVNEEKGVVVAVLEGVEYDAIDLLMRKNKYLSYPSMWPRTQPFMLKDKYVGKAKCMEGDVFNIEVGKELAKERLLLKYYKDLYKASVNFVEEMMTTSGKHMEKIWRKYQNIKLDLKGIENVIK